MIFRNTSFEVALRRTLYRGAAWGLLRLLISNNNYEAGLRNRVSLRRQSRERLNEISALNLGLRLEECAILLAHFCDEPI